MGLGEMALARTGRPEQERVFALGDEAGGGELEDERAVDLLVEGEVEAVEGAVGVAEAGLLVSPGEQAVLAPLEFVGDERSDDLFDLGLLPARFEDVGHSLAPYRACPRPGIFSLTPHEGDAGFDGGANVLLRTAPGPGPTALGRAAGGRHEHSGRADLAAVRATCPPPAPAQPAVSRATTSRGPAGRNARCPRPGRLIFRTKLTKAAAARDTRWRTHGPPPVNPTTSESRTFGKAPMRTAGAA